MYASIEQYAYTSLDGSDYGAGSIEAVTRTAQNSSRAIGRLLDILSERDFLSAREVVNIIEGYDNVTAEFVVLNNNDKEIEC